MTLFYRSYYNNLKIWHIMHQEKIFTCILTLLYFYLSLHIYI